MFHVDLCYIIISRRKWRIFRAFLKKKCWKVSWLSHFCVCSGVLREREKYLQLNKEWINADHQKCGAITEKNTRTMREVIMKSDVDLHLIKAVERNLTTVGVCFSSKPLIPLHLLSLVIYGYAKCAPTSSYLCLKTSVCFNSFIFLYVSTTLKLVDNVVQILVYVWNSIRLKEPILDLSLFLT